MNTFPAPSPTMSHGPFRHAPVALLPSEQAPGLPLPAKVEIVPVGVTSSTRCAPHDATYRLPAESAHAAVGSFRQGTSAAAPSLQEPAVPLPATALMVPPGVTLRTRWLRRSAM